MVFDSIASIPTAASAAKDFAKKKRANRSAKLKQCKLDARREQWLSQVKNKVGKEELNSGVKIASLSMHERGKRGRPLEKLEKLEINSRAEENEGSMSHHYSDFESSPSNSPSSSVLGSNGSGTNFTGSSSSSSSSRGCCSGSITEEDEDEDDDDDGCLDDWEAVADALAADERKDEPDNPNLEFQQGDAAQFDSAPAPKPEGTVRMTTGNCRAWRPDDTFRPQSLPNLLKQHSFPMNSERHCGRGWVCTNVVSAPSSCPICCEDLDLTDSSFLPCTCGFRLCLFCHKRILEDDGRCPGCRKQYEQCAEGDGSSDGNSLTPKLARSYSMIARS